MRRPSTSPNNSACIEEMRGKNVRNRRAVLQVVIITMSKHGFLSLGLFNYCLFRLFKDFQALCIPFLPERKLSFANPTHSGLEHPLPMS